MWIMNYLLVALIPFRPPEDGSAIVDGLWAEDLRGLRDAMGQVTVAAPERTQGNEFKAWGPGEVSLHPQDGIRFVGLPFFHNQIGAWLGSFRLRNILRHEVAKADLVHSSNFFAPYLGLAYAHRIAVRSGKKTLFVVAEDFYDFMQWNLAESGTSGLRRLRSKLLLEKQDRLCRECLSSATVSFLHTPAAVKRYRLSATNGMAIRQPIHEAQDVIVRDALQNRLEHAATGIPLRLVVACRLEPLKGIDYLLRAVHLLKRQRVGVSLDIYGSGSQKQRLIDLASLLEIQDCVTIYDP